MTILQRKMLYSIGLESLLIPLMYVAVTYGIAFGLFLLAGLHSDLVPVGYLIGVVLSVATIVLWLLFQKTLMKQLIKSRMQTYSEKSQQKVKEAFTILNQDLEDVAGNSWKLALGKPRGNYKDRYNKREKYLTLLYKQSARYDEKEIELAALLDYL